MARQHSGNRMDFGRFQRLLEGEVGQNRRQSARQHGLPASGRSRHQNIVGARGGHFESPLDVFLPAHLGKIVSVGALQDRCETGIDAERSHLDFAIDQGYRLAEVTHGKNLRAGDQGALFGIVDRQDKGAAIPVAGGHGNRQDPSDRLDPTVQRQFAEQNEIFQIIAVDAAGRAEQPDGNRQVESGPVLADIGRCQVDCDSAGREIVPGIFDRRLDPVLAFLDRAFGKPHRGKLRQPLSDVDLDLNRVRIDPDQGA